MGKEIISGVIGAVLTAAALWAFGYIGKIPSLITIPSGAIIAFNDTECPDEGWKEYQAAYGKFLRGIDKSGQKFDPEGKRTPSSIQRDDFKSHSHNHFIVGWGAGSHDPSHGRVDRNSPENRWSSKTESNGGPETRPINVAVLFCEKT